MTTYRDAPPGVSYGLSFQSVTSMYEDTDGKIWMGTDGGGLNLFDPAKEMFQKYPKTSDMKIVSIMPYSDSELLLSLFGVGLCLFNKTTGECREFRLNWGNVRNDLFLLGNAVRLYRVDENRFYLLTDNYFCVYDTKKQQFESLPEDMIPHNFLAPCFVSGDSCYISSSKAIYVLDFPHKQLRPLFVTKEEFGTIISVKQDKIKRSGWGLLPDYMYMTALHKR